MIHRCRCCLQKVSRIVTKNWGGFPGTINTGDLEYPTMSMLFENIKKLFNKYQYAADVRMNLESVLRVRIGSLTQREMGDIFDVKNPPSVRKNG